MSNQLVSFTSDEEGFLLLVDDALASPSSEADQERGDSEEYGLRLVDVPQRMQPLVAGAGSRA